MKRILNKRMLIILGVGIFCVGLIGIWIAYFSEIRKQDDLSEQLSVVEEKTANISIEDILNKQQAEEERIADLEEQIADAQQIISLPLVTSSVFHDILTTANSTDINITNINSNPLSNEAITGVNYRIITIDFSAGGRAVDLYEFIDSMSHYFTTGILKTLSVNIQEETASANMRLTIYSFKS